MAIYLGAAVGLVQRDAGTFSNIVQLSGTLGAHAGYLGNLMPNLAVDLASLVSDSRKHPDRGRRPADTTLRARAPRPENQDLLVAGSACESCNLRLEGVSLWLTGRGQG